MSVVKNGICEFCGKKRKWTVATSFHGFYCEECMSLLREEEINAKRDIRIARAKEKENNHNDNR